MHDELIRCLGTYAAFVIAAAIVYACGYRRGWRRAQGYAKMANEAESAEMEDLFCKEGAFKTPDLLIAGSGSGEQRGIVLSKKDYDALVDQLTKDLASFYNVDTSAMSDLLHQQVQGELPDAMGKYGYQQQPIQKRQDKGERYGKRI